MTVSQISIITSTLWSQNANTLPELISPGKSNNCIIGVVCTTSINGKRTPGSSSRWSGGTWTVKKYSQIKGLLYSKEPALQHQFNEAIDKLIRFREAEISSETCIKWPNQTKPSIFGTSRRISQP